MHTNLLVKSESGKILYAVAYNKLVRKRNRLRWIPQEVEYLHANDAVEARAAVIHANARHQIDIIAVGPAIGFHVEDEKKVILSAS